VSHDLDLTESAVRQWVRQARIDAGGGKKGELTTAEHAELVALRREAKQLRMEREILKKAAAFFAKENH
jgi:transposase